MGSQMQAKCNTNSDSDDSDVVITIIVLRVKEEVLDYKDLSPPLPNYINSFDVKSYAKSINSI
jgi:hypothetical protein